jgi:hypothetical protein
MTPYNTGKVKIGVAYKPPQRPPTMSRDELRLQEALLTKERRYISKPLIAYIAIWIAVVILVRMTS